MEPLSYIYLIYRRTQSTVQRETLKFLIHSCYVP